MDPRCMGAGSIDLESQEPWAWGENPRGKEELWIRRTGKGVSEYKAWLGVWLRSGTGKGRCNQQQFN